MRNLAHRPGGRRDRITILCLEARCGRHTYWAIMTPEVVGAGCAKASPRAQARDEDLYKIPITTPQPTSRKPMRRVAPHLGTKTGRLSARYA